MKLPLHIAQKLRQLKHPGALLPASLMHHPVVEKMLEDGILQKKQLGNTRSQVYLPDAGSLDAYLHNHFGIGDLNLYIEKQTSDILTRADAIEISGNSKLKSIRTFSGFLANVVEPIACTMRGNPFTLQPLPGCFTFIQDYQHFLPPPGATIVGIENSENFTYVDQQQYLFKAMPVLFVSRYPQSNDLLKWLQAIPNTYLHFGDLDFEGINIYNNEFKKQLGDRASFYIPPNMEELLLKYGNRPLYNQQLSRAPQLSMIAEPGIQQLLNLLHHHKKALEQEIFIRKEG